MRGRTSSRVLLNIFTAVFSFHWTTGAPVMVDFPVCEIGDAVVVAQPVLQKDRTPQKQMKKRDVTVVTHHKRDLYLEMSE